MNEGIFVGPQIKQLFVDQDFGTKLNCTERRAFQNFCRNFLGDEKAENCSDDTKELISSYSAVACNVSLKANFPRAHLDFFLETWTPSPVNMTKGSNRIFPTMERSTRKMESKCVG